MKIDERKIITENEIGYIISFMLNSAEIEMGNHIYYDHEVGEYKGKYKRPSKYWRDTYKSLQLFNDPKVYQAMFDAVSKHLKDNEELLIMYGHLDKEVVKYCGDNEE